MRPTGLGHGVYKDVPDYGIYCGEWCIGRILKLVPVLLNCAGSGLCTSQQASEDYTHTDNRTATLEQAKASSRRAGSSGWKAWAGLEEIA
jgi:hypothetical protein